jgi:hypothetical protein
MSKIYLDECYFCHESKAAIKYSQSIKDPIYCVGMSGYESPEVDWERDRHCFVVTEEQMATDKEAEAHMYDAWTPENSEVNV